MLKVIDFRTLYFSRIKSKGYYLLNNHNETQIRKVVNYLSKELKYDINRQRNYALFIISGNATLKRLYRICISTKHFMYVVF